MFIISVTLAIIYHVRFRSYLEGERAKAPDRVNNKDIGIIIDESLQDTGSEPTIVIDESHTDYGSYKSSRWMMMKK